MTIQTLTIGRQRFVVVRERDFKRLQQRAGVEVREEFAEEALQELRRYRRTGKAADWADVKRRLKL